MCTGTAPIVPTGETRVEPDLDLDGILRENRIPFDTVGRDDLGGPPIGRGRIAKTLLLADARGYAVAVIPGNRQIDLLAIRREFGRSFRLGRPDETDRLFPGTPPNALPPVGGDPRLETFLDLSLVRLRDVFLETRDPRRLIRIVGESFRALFYGAWCGPISRAVNPQTRRFQPAARTR